MCKLIDIHSHTLQNKFNGDCISIFNYYRFDQPLPESIKFSAGIHPLYISSVTDDKEFLNQISENTNCVAIGECGLDKRKKENLEIQIEIFKFQVNLAQKKQKPLIIHNVGYGFKILEILKTNKFSETFIFHGFNQKTDLAQSIIKLGGYISFGKSLVNLNSNAQNSLKFLPINRILFETDEGNVDIHEIYKTASHILQIKPQELEKIITENFYNAFKINYL